MDKSQADGERQAGKHSQQVRELGTGQGQHLKNKWGTTLLFMLQGGENCSGCLKSELLKPQFMIT